jgi:Zn-dependent M28 family amino/carboxypeptidase
MSELPDLDALAERLRGHLDTLACRPRSPGSTEHSRAAAYISVALKQAGFTVQKSTSRPGGADCRNLLTQPLPDDPTLPLVIIGAHYDSVLGSPGADDNGSAVAALLELARWVRPLLDGAGPWHARLQLAAYDLEEFGLIGSDLHSGEVQRDRLAVRGMISLEMLGYTDHRPGSQNLPPALAGLYPDVGNFIGVVGNQTSAALLQTVTAALKEVEGLPVEFMAVPGNGELVPQTRLSDHSSFWDRGYPALMITDTSFFRNPHYHQATDTPDTLDYPFLARVTAGVCAAVLRLLRAERLPGP